MQRSSTGPASDAGKRRLPLIVYVLGGCIFLMGTTEFVIAGLLNEIAATLNVSVSRAGLLITAFAVGMIIGAPVMSLVTLRLPHRSTLMLALGVFAVGHVFAALSASFWLLAAARFVTALATGTFWGVSSVVAAQAAGPEARARSQAVLVGGLTLANVVGVPLGAAVGNSLGWRAPFWILAGLAVAAMLLIARQVPAASGRSDVSVRAEFAALRQIRVWVIYLATAPIVGGVLGAYSYVSPLLTRRVGLPERFVSVVLIGFGLGALCGITIGGHRGDRHPYRVALTAAVVSAGVLAAIALWADNIPVAIVLIVLLGAFGLMPNGIFTAEAIKSARSAPTLASALSTSAFNLGIAVSSWLAGLTVSTSLQLKGPALTGLALVLLGLVPLGLLAAARGGPLAASDVRQERSG